MFLKVRKSIANIPSKLPHLGDLDNLGQLPVQEVPSGTDDFVLRVFTIYSVFLFEINLFIVGIPTELPFLGDFEYPGQPFVNELLPVGDLKNLQNRKLFWIFGSPSGQA